MVKFYSHEQFQYYIITFGLLIALRFQLIQNCYTNDFSNLHEFY